MLTSIAIADSVKALLYSANRPKLAQALVDSMDACVFVEANVESKMLLLGALLALGKTAEFNEMLQLSDFSEVGRHERSLLAVNIFSVFLDEQGGLPSNHTTLSSLLDLLTTICPEELTAHENSIQVPLVDRLIAFDYAKCLNNSVKGVVFFRECVFEHGSRKHEFGYRIATAMASQGWEISLLSVVDIPHFCVNGQYDVALVDVAALGVSSGSADVVLTVLRRYFRKIIMIEPDPWRGSKDALLLEVADYIDCIWGFTADWKLIKTPQFRAKSILFPNVGGFETLDHNMVSPISWDHASFSFVGSVQIYNIHRVYWLLEMLLKDMPISIRVTDPEVDDGLDRSLSLLQYAKSLASSSASINFTTRCDGTRILTGRSVEVISLKRLLIQETCPVFHRYYIEGEHFLEFSDIDGLEVLIDFLSSHPKTAQLIAEQGYRFYQDRYSSKKMIEHLQTWL